MQISTFQKQAIQALAEIYDRVEAQAVVNYLLEHITELSSSQLSIYKHHVLLPTQLAALEAGMIRLQAQEPVQYVTGTAYFWDELFDVSPAVLIPRQETEELVDWVVKENVNKSAKRNPSATIDILDIGTGSGCIAISLAKSLEQARVHALDSSAEALNIAKRNAQKLGVEIEFYLRDIHDAGFQDFEEIDIIVSNPPYVQLSEQSEMPTYVLDHEPAQALFVPDERPLLFYEKIAQLGQAWLKEQGQLFVEINESLGQEVLSLFTSMGYRKVSLRQDLNQKDRMVRAWK